ncbi:MAG: hypothetical protein OJJ54_19760 [Pseudonocardia sp.]|nr:hypothetical protein [Pseudonocardia sp.]
MTWTLASGQVDGAGVGEDLGMGGVGGSSAGARPARGPTWACPTTSTGRLARADALAAALPAFI